MEQEKFEEYLRDRYLRQIQWYDSKSATIKQLYTIFQWIVISLSALIPVLVVTLEDDLKWLTAGLAVALAIGTAGLNTFRFKENWIIYRTIGETLKKEKHFYDAGLEDYTDAPEKNALFIERVESLISREHSLWVSVHKPKEEKEKRET